VSSQADEAVRVRLGARAETQPDVLADLARDPSVTVRASLALNAAAPSRANEALANDSDERVRILLARKLAALMPGLSTTDQARLYDDTWNTLRKLVADEAVRVRAIIADAVKSLPDAPRDLILRLAADTEVPVYEPVIRLSPLLSTEDLISLVVRAPAPGTAHAVARREWLAPAVSDVIAASADNRAIRALLANPRAQIREETLDALAERAVEHTDWHEPLVSRPTLSPRAARLLSEIVASHLLAILATRGDLPPSLSEELRERVAARLTQEAPAHPDTAPMTMEQALVEANALAKAGRLNEESLLEASRRGEARRAAALLSVACKVPLSMVEHAMSLRSAKGMISLVWKAGYTMRSAVALQTLLARLPPCMLLAAGPAGSFPLSIEEMRWQLEFLGRSDR
jgi:uncharacterized protein (DUF2336 family)